MKNFIKWLINADGISWATFLIVVAQGFHYFHFFDSFELFGTIINYIYALFLTVVFSFPLMIFTAKLGTLPTTFGTNSARDRMEAVRKKYKEGVNMYMYMDIFINIYTWYIQLEVFNKFEWSMFPKYLVSTLVAVMLPVTLKKFAGEIRIK